MVYKEARDLFKCLGYKQIYKETLSGFMQNIKIKIATLVEGVPWLFSGQGNMSENQGEITLQATEDIQGENVFHSIKIDKSKETIQITRLAENNTKLLFYREKLGDITMETQFGTFSGKIITKSMAIKQTQWANHISITYNTDFDQVGAQVKKIQISYWEI